MARPVVCALTLLVAGSLSTPTEKISVKVADSILALRQNELNELVNHIHEPNHIPSCQAISKTWLLEKNLEHFINVNAVKLYIQYFDHNWVLPKGVPFDIHTTEHQFEAFILFHVLYSAKDYDTFYKTSVFLRDRINENLFIYVLSIVIVNRPDTQGIRIVPLYEIFPWYYFNGEVMTTAQRINTHRHHMIDYYPSTYQWGDNVVIRWNDTLWPYHNSLSLPISYYTHDPALNTMYYNFHILQPSWLGGEQVPFINDRRGEMWWYFHKNLVARFYLERLSNGLGEIPQLGEDVVKEGYYSGLLYHNGVAFPYRPDYFHLDQPYFIDILQEIHDCERRIRDAIEKGYAINAAGEHISLRTPESIDVLGRLIEASVDSPNLHFYKDFISLWKKVLGNSFVQKPKQHNHYVPLVLPSVLEHYQTAMRDPAFYMIWQRVLGLFKKWQENLPYYKREELALPAVAIQKVEVDKLLTYFEQTYTNVTGALYMSESESDDISVLVQQPKLNHKAFQVRVHVKSEVPKTVVVKFFLGPKHDSHGNEIPLNINTQNFYQFDEFVYELPVGQTCITRNSAEAFAVHDFRRFVNFTTTNAWNAAEGQGDSVITHPQDLEKMPHHALLPKGRVGGMQFVLVVYISEYRAPKVPRYTGYDPSVSLGIRSGARYLTDEPFGFPFNRPVHSWQVEGLNNIAIQDVEIHHKCSPEIQVPHCD